jgi:hypothetical protein
MEIRTDNFFLTIAPEYWPHLLMGILLVGVFAFCYIRAVEGWTIWTRILGEVRPSLESAASPLDQTLTGCGGFIAAVFNVLLTLVFLIMAIDQLLFLGWLWERIVVWASGQLPLM